jgi:NAD(P)-dependent dehydrogenase (short-subunit alcohol dehydrogenase family)
MSASNESARAGAATGSFARSRSLDGKTVLVTGAGRGIGYACALACAEAGAEVIAVARTPADLEALRSTAVPGSVSPRVADITSGEFIQFVRELPRLDVLVNNAGTNKLQTITEVDAATLDLLLDLNVRGAFRVTQAATVRMIELKQGGSIIHITSQFGHVGAEKRSVYCMTKHALEGLTKALAIELAPQGIRVNSVAPTIVKTSMTAPFLEDPTYREFAMATIPLKRIATPEDVANAVVYLASPASQMVTGTSLRVDGGATAQ